MENCLKLVNPSWDWPLSEEGLAKCQITEEKFSVALDFKYLMSNNSEIKKFDGLKTNTFMFTIGLASVDNNEETQSNFWRFEIQVVRHLNLILIEAHCEVHRPSPASLNRRMKKLRKVYKLPFPFDVSTLNATLAEADGWVLLEAYPKPLFNNNINNATKK